MALIPVVIETHNRHLEEREAPITRNTDVRNVNWVDGVFFLFSQSCTRQTTDFNHPFHQRAVIHLKAGLGFFAVMTFRASQHFVSWAVCIGSFSSIPGLHPLDAGTSPHLWQLIILQTSSNIPQAIKFLSTHPHYHDSYRFTISWHTKTLVCDGMLTYFFFFSYTLFLLSSF